MSSSEPTGEQIKVANALMKWRASDDAPPLAGIYSWPEMLSLAAAALSVSPLETDGRPIRVDCRDCVGGMVDGTVRSPTCETCCGKGYLTARAETDGERIDWYAELQAYRAESKRVVRSLQERIADLESTRAPVVTAVFYEDECENWTEIAESHVWKASAEGRRIADAVLTVRSQEGGKA